MLPSQLTSEIETLIRRGQPQWIEAVCSQLCRLPATTDTGALISSFPRTSNSDAAHTLEKIIRQIEGTCSWEALGLSIQLCSKMHKRWKDEQTVKLLWSGPCPASEVASRRLEQTLYDLILGAKREILLVTFAAYKISRLNDALTKAIERGIRVRLILEFEGESEGQLSVDAADAFSGVLRQGATIYYWPLERRQRNAAGKPGKLHAKVAVIDDTAVISSANLTDDAFNRNLELGTLISGREVSQKLRDHFASLCAEGVLQLLSTKHLIGKDATSVIK